MSKALVFCMLVLPVLLGVCSCSGQPSPEDSEEQAILNVIEANLKASQAEDLDGVMATLHPQSAAYGDSRRQYDSLFTTYDFKYSLKKCRVVEKTSDHALVEFIQITKKINGPAFRNNRVTGVHEMKKESNKWKIYSSTLKKVDFL